MGVQLNARLVESFAGTFLSPRYDSACPTPQFHRDAWALYTSSCKQAGVIAPRDHAKSTSLTFDYILAEVLFRTSDYVILIGSTEDKAAEQLSNISEELSSNAELRAQFGVKGFESEQKTDIIVVMLDGHRFRILARGAEQKIRGAMWKGKRPNLIVCDDMEDDEQVMNKDRRLKFRQWFFRAAKQALSKSGKIRIHGTILHEDALLARLMKNKMWKMLFFKAHRSYDDFSDLLWPERWTIQDLKDRRTEFEEDGDSAGYSQEFLNTPLDNAAAYLRKQDFIPMSAEDREAEKLVVAGLDFAISKKDGANQTSITVAGRCARNLTHHLYNEVGRLDALEITELFFDVYDRFDEKIDAFFVEDGQIWLGVKAIIEREMQRRNKWLVIVPLKSITDKGVRGRVWQKKHRAGACRYDKDADWYPAYEAEVLTFTGVSDAKADDRFDSTAILHRGLEDYADLEPDDFKEESVLEEEYESRRLYSGSGSGRSSVTGY